MGLATMLGEVRQFIREEVVPLEQRFLQGSFKELVPTLQTLRQKVKSLGWWAPQIPQEYGGMGLSLPAFAPISEELGRSPLGHYLFNCQAPDSGNMELLIAHGTAKQKEQYLLPLASGQIRSCFSMTEPEYPGSNPTWMATTAVKEGSDYIIDGHKWFTSSAEGATFAIVMAVTDPHAPAHKRASQIIVPTNTPGFQIVRNIPVMGTGGSDHASHAEVRYEGCVVPQSNRLGGEGEGFTLAQERLGPGRIHHCMRWIGICERAFELMCQRAVSRQLSPGQRLADQQIVQHWIAESRAEINAARLLVMEAAHKIEEQGGYAARVEISIIKFFVANTLQRVLDRAIQVHGALGMTDDTPLAFWFAHERAARIYDGADEVHKAAVAKQLLKEMGR